MRAALFVLAIIGPLAPAALSQTPDSPEAVVQALMSDDAATHATGEAAAVKLGAPMVRPLCDLMAQGSTKAITVAERALFAIAAAVSASDATAMRDPVVEALAAEIRAKRPAAVRNQAAHLLGLFGTKQATEALFEALADTDTFGAALVALQRQPSTEVVRALAVLATGAHPTERHLPRSLAPDRTDALLRAVGAMRNRQATPYLVAYLQTPGARKPAALDALAMIADPKAATALAEAARDPAEAVRRAAVAALIALADAEQQRGGELARRCYRRAYDYAVTPAQKTAALLGLANTDPAMRAEWLLRGMADEHTRPVVQAELLKLDAAQLSKPLILRMKQAQGEELEALRGLAQAKGIDTGN